MRFARRQSYRPEDAKRALFYERGKSYAHTFLGSLLSTTVHSILIAETGGDHFGPIKISLQMLLSAKEEKLETASTKKL